MKYDPKYNQVRWECLLPQEFLERLNEKPLVYLPLGLCEPHGHIAPFGLDTLKAEYLCLESAYRNGGIVAPTLGYQIHESGMHAPWLQEVVGDVNPRLGGMPPEIMLKFFLYQLRAFYNAGFKCIMGISGHSGGNQEDFRRVADTFMKEVDCTVIFKSDPELLTSDKWEGDHAGIYEISQLLYLHPELMDMSRLDRVQSDALRQFAQGEDASEASQKAGKEIMEELLASIKDMVTPLNTATEAQDKMLDYALMEKIWDRVIVSKPDWTTAKPHPDQTPLEKSEKWHEYQNL